MDFSELEEAEKRAIFRALWEMARVDGRVVELERLRLEELHTALFALAMPKTAYPYPEAASLAEHVQRSEAREALFAAVFVLLRADERTTPAERELFSDLCSRLDVGADEEAALWERNAHDYFARRSNQLAAQRLDKLGDELVVLAEDLGVGVDQDTRAEAEVRRAAATFTLDAARQRRWTKP
ncbi:MAG: hypothetical protein JRH20_19185 [Deltaproteobacteria bacterium]|nr:hypothetical protein [Deltaproteobacteria bacterium]